MAKKQQVNEQPNIAGWQEALDRERLRIATRALPMLIGAAVVYTAAFVGIYLSFGRPWQWAWMIFEGVLVLVAAIIAYVLARRNRLPTAVYTVVLGINALAIIGPALVEGMGKPGILTAFMAIILGRLLGNRTQNRVVVIVSGVAMATGMLLSVFPVFEKHPTSPWVEASLTAGTMMVVVFVTGLVLDARDARYENSLAQAEAHARELDERRQLMEEQTQALARRSRYLQVTAEVAREAAAIRDLNQLLEETVHLISDRFGFYHAGLFLVDQEKEHAVLRAASSEGGERMLARGHRLKVGEVGIVGYTAETGKPRIALDVGEDATFFDNPDLPRTRSEMALPLKVRERVIGVLDVQSTEAAAFTDDDVSTLQTLADQVALAIENARLLAEAQERVREISSLLQGESRDGWIRLSQDHPDWGYVYEGVEISKIVDSGFQPAEEAQLTLPLQVRGETIGRLKLGLGDRQPTSEERALVQAVADQASQALESARLFQETQRALGETEALYRASQAIVAAETPEQILRAFTDHVIPPQIRRCALALMNPNDPLDDPMVTIEAAWQPGVRRPALLGSHWRISQVPLLGQVRREPLAVSNVASSSEIDKRLRQVLQQAMGVRAVALIPLITGERLLGWTLLGSPDKVYEFSEREIRLYRTLADQAAVALAGMQLLEETERRVERERLTAEITSRVRNSADVETILRTAIGELGRSLRASDGLIRVGDGAGAESEPARGSRRK